MSDTKRLPPHITEADIRLITELAMPVIVAAVRADQIEKDARIAEKAADADSMIVFSGQRVGNPALLDIARAIRAQKDTP